MIETAAKSFLMDPNAVVLVIILSLLAFVITKTVIDNPIISYSSLPAYFWSAMYAHYWFREAGVIVSGDRVANLAFACGAGFMVAILGLVLFYRVTMSLTSN